jgi:hypothetical protein
MRMHRVQFSMAHPGAEGEQVTEIVPMKDGSGIQSKSFDMWCQEPADAA